jgi:hypothetical protein
MVQENQQTANAVVMLAEMVQDDQQTADVAAA